MMSRCSKESRSSVWMPAAVVTTCVSTGIGGSALAPATRPEVTRNGRTAGARPAGPAGGSSKASLPAGVSPPVMGVPSLGSAAPTRTGSSGRSGTDGVLQFEHQRRVERGAGPVGEHRHLVGDVAELRLFGGDDAEHRPGADRGHQDVAVLQVDDDLVQAAQAVVAGGAGGQ